MSEANVKSTSHEHALAVDMFDHFCSANTMKHILGLHREICEILNLKPDKFTEFYPKYKHMLSSSWKAQALFKKFETRASLTEYDKGLACKMTKVLIIGAGPCGLRAAIELQLLGAKVIVIEKRDRITRNNVVHLWPFVIEDLKALGAKKFYGKFCAGSIDHVSIRQLQCMLLKMALSLGVEIHENVEFQELLEPMIHLNNETFGWRASVKPHEHPVSEYEFDCLIGADGRRNTLADFSRKEFRGKMALAITANFINRKTQEEAAVPEISGVSYIFRQKFFNDMMEQCGIDLENIVYYKDETHYFVMTAKKQSLVDKGVLKQDYVDVNLLLSASNTDKMKLCAYAREAAQYATNNGLPQYEFALNHYGDPDVALFDFTSVYAAENASYVRSKLGHRLLIQLVGDSLIEPFWPTGSGIGRGFLSVFDASWTIRRWASLSCDMDPLIVVNERESIYSLLTQTKPENLNSNLAGYTINPQSRYKNYNKTQHRTSCKQKYYTTDKYTTDIDTKEPLTLDIIKSWSKLDVEKGRDILVPANLAQLFRQYRPDLLPTNAPDDSVYNILDKYYHIRPTNLRREPGVFKFLSQLYCIFKGEVKYVHKESDYYNALKREKKLLQAKSMGVERGRRQRQRLGLTHTSPVPTLTNEGTAGTVWSALKEPGKTPLKEPVKQKKIRREKKLQLKVIGVAEISRQSRRRRGLTLSSPVRNLLNEGTGGIVKPAESGPLARGVALKDPNAIVKRPSSPLPHCILKDWHARQNTARPAARQHVQKQQQSGDVRKQTPGPSKPKDLLRAVGKINKEDWNIREIEKKMEENRMGKPVPKMAEKVPKWDKEQFLISKNRITSTKVPDAKWQSVDETITKCDRKLNDSGRPEQGTKKVADLAKSFLSLQVTETDNNNIAAPDVTPKKSWIKSSTNVYCVSCQLQVFAAENVIADGLQLHKACFKCVSCKTPLRPGHYIYDRVQNLLFCIPHGRSRSSNIDYLLKVSTSTIQTEEPCIVLPSIKAPERISSIDDEERGEIDEAEWTDRNFLTSFSNSSDDENDEDSSDDSYSDAESCIEEILNEASRPSSPYALDMQRHLRQMNYVSDDSYGEDDLSDGVESSEKDSCSRLREARELRRQEVPQGTMPQQLTDSSEVESEEESSESSEQSSATAVSTDSEFEEEVPTAPDPPAITVTVAPIEEPKVFQPREYPLNRARSSGGLASKRALELKRRYLLGESCQPAVRKSDSTSRLDTKLVTFQETISEFQKLLNPAPLPQSTNKPSIFLSLFDKTPMPDVILNASKQPDLLSKVITPQPEIIKEDDITPTEPKALAEISNGDTSSDSESAVTETLTKSVPRVEVHDEVGDLIQLDSLMIIPSECSKDDKGSTQPTQSSSTPIPAKDTDSSDSCKYGPLTDTEWEWAADNTVLEDCILDESRCQRNVNNKNPRTLSNPKLVHDAKNISAISSHVCGRISPTIVYSNALDHFQFADEGEQDINPIINATNDGYMELVDDSYIDYSPDNDRSMSYIVKNSDVCQPLSNENDLPEVITPEVQVMADNVVDNDNEICKITNTKSEPVLSPLSFLPTQEKVQEIKREREQQTEVVRRLVLDRLGKSPMESRKSYRKPRQMPGFTPPPVPPLEPEPTVMQTKPPRPALPANPYPGNANHPEEPKHNRIMDGLSNFLSKITILHPSRNNNSSGALASSEAPPVPPLPAQYCTPMGHQGNARPISEEQASAVAELVQVSAQQDAHRAMLEADRRRTRTAD